MPSPPFFHNWFRTMNLLAEISLGATEQQMNYFERAELIRKQNLWPEHYMTKTPAPPPVPLNETFEKPKKFVAKDWSIQKTAGGGAFCSITKTKDILAPIQIYRLALEEMIMLFLNIDVAGEKRKQRMSFQNEEQAIIRAKVKKDENLPPTNTEIMLSIINVDESKTSKGPGTSALFQMSLALNDSDSNNNNNPSNINTNPLVPVVESDDDQIYESDDENPKSKKKRKSLPPSRKPPKQNNLTYHKVLFFTRQNLKQHRNQRQKTHELKRIVLSELTRKVYHDKKLWFTSWNLQETLLEEAVKVFVANKTLEHRLTSDPVYRKQVSERSEQQAKRASRN